MGRKARKHKQDPPVPPAKPSRKRRIGMAVLATATGCWAAVGLLEIILFVFDPFPLRIHGHSIHLDRNKRYEVSDLRLAGTDEMVVHTKNSIGFRGPEPPSDFDDTLTILAVGGSTTECFYLSDGKDWPNRLLDRLREHRGDVWLNNAGLDGHSTFGHQVLLVQYVLALKPDVVLFLVGANEIGRTECTMADQREQALFLEESAKWSWLRGQVSAWAPYSRSCALVDNMLRHRDAVGMDLVHGGNLHATSFELIAEDAAGSGLAPDIRAEHRAIADECYRERVRTLLWSCRQRNVVPVLVTQPTLAGPGRDPVMDIDLGRLKVGERSGQQYWELLEIYNDIVRAVATDEGVLLIDLAREMPRSTAYYYDHLHYTIAGADVAAGVVSRHLTPYLDRAFPVADGD